ncbi:MAG: NADP-dependent oxidoreductase [Solirubrobacteraceae bacterium]|nr:MAG: NADP-dependent oxidoreductase [Solirubrobacterales bacterium]
MSNEVNHTWRLARRPVGLPEPDVWSYEQEPIPEPHDGEVLVRNHYISLDPAMRGWMNEGRSYAPPVGIGGVMRAYAAGRVVASRHAGFAEGDHVVGLLGVQEYARASGDAVFKVDPEVAPLPVHLGTLGMPGMTAYFGLLEVGKPAPGNTVVVSAAAGAVGSIVGQIAKLKECRVVGVAGGPQKCEYVVAELGFDAAIDYKADDVGRALHEHCPQGIDVYFDNVGGEILDAALANLALQARVVICGAISQYNNSGPMKGPANYMSLLVNRASMTGMLVSDWLPRWGDAAKELAGWLAAGQLHSREDIIEGIEAFPDALVKLFTGENNGKLVLKVGED